MKKIFKLIFVAGFCGGMAAIPLPHHEAEIFWEPDKGGMNHGKI